MRNIGVIARNEIDGFYYPGFVSSPQNNETVLVRFYDIKPAKVGQGDVIYIGGAIPWPDIQVGDYALSRVMCRTSRVECYVPGVVLVLPRGQAYQTRFYTLQLFNGRYVEKLRRHVVKIAPEKFKAIFNYIAELRYGTLRRSVTVECLYSNREPRPKMRKTWSSSSSLVSLYRDKTEKINIYRLHDCTNKRNGEPKISVMEIGKQNLDRSRDKLKSDESVESDSTSSWRRKQKRVRPQRRNKHHSKDTKTVTKTTIKKPEDVQRVNGKSSSLKPLNKNSRTSSSQISSSINSISEPKRTLQEGQEVLARWSDDGWCYRGTVVRKDGDDRYIVRDIAGYTESILLDDILLDSDNEFNIIQPFDHVVALHPNYVFSYAPGTVKEVYNNGLTVIFYDKTQHKVSNSEVYQIKHSKYIRYVEYIKNQEGNLAKSVVIARDDKTGIYQKCEIICPEGTNQKFIIKWPSGELGRQAGHHIFQVATRNQCEQMINWRYALVPIDESSSFYLPAQVLQTDPFRVKIFNQSSEVSDLKRRKVMNLNSKKANEILAEATHSLYTNCGEVKLFHKRGNPVEARTRTQD